MFKKIPNFSKYVINEQGEIRCVIGNKIIPTHRSNGYVFVHIVNDEGRRMSVGLHRCLALAFIPCPGDPEKLIVNHKDTCRWNNQLSNLEWATRSRNQQHAVEEGVGSAFPTIVIDLDTNEEKKFPSRRAALRYYGISNDVLCKRKNGIVGKYKFVSQTENLGYERFAEKLSGLIVRNIFTGKITILRNLHETARFTNIEAKVIKRILKGARFTFPVNGYDIRTLGSEMTWPEYSAEELEAFRDLFFIHNPIWVIKPSGEKVLFGSVLRASAFTETYERTIRECIKNGKPCARGFRYEKHNRKSIANT